MDFSALLFGLLTTLAGTNAQEILQGTSDAFAGNMDLQILTDISNNAVGFRGIAGGKSQDTALNGFAQGIVLYAVSGKNAVTIQSANFDPAQGGVVDITYLQNGITGNYQSITVDIVNNGTAWEMLTDDQTGRNLVTHGYLKANKFFGKVIGIDSITLTP